MRLIPLVLAAALLTGCTAAGQAAPAKEPRANSVAMAKSYRFEPVTIRVPVGTEVTWVNEDNFTHDVQMLTGDEWQSSPVRPGERVSHTFSQAGTFPYQCAFHPQDMRGTVIVE